MNGLGILYENGWGAPKNANKAKDWYELSAEKGFYEAQYRLGLLYRNGQLGTPDETNALYWLKIACNNNSMEACQALKD